MELFTDYKRITQKLFSVKKDLEMYILSMETEYNYRIKVLEEKEDKLTKKLNLVRKIKTSVMSYFDRIESEHQEGLLEFQSQKMEQEAKLRCAKINSENYLKGLIHTIENLKI